MPKSTEYGDGLARRYPYLNSHQVYNLTNTNSFDYLTRDMMQLVRLQPLYDIFEITYWYNFHCTSGRYAYIYAELFDIMCSFCVQNYYPFMLKYRHVKGDDFCYIMFLYACFHFVLDIHEYFFAFCIV